jgi:hypothetical protein
MLSPFLKSVKEYELLLLLMGNPPISFGGARLRHLMKHIILLFPVNLHVPRVETNSMDIY